MNNYTITNPKYTNGVFTGFKTFEVTDSLAEVVALAKELSKTHGTVNVLQNNKRVACYCYGAGL